MGFVAALLSVKVYLAARTGPVPRVVLPPKTLLARPRFDPRPVHRKMLVRQIRLGQDRSEEHTSELQSQSNLVCRLLLAKKKLPYRWESALLEIYCTQRHMPHV